MQWMPRVMLALRSFLGGARFCVFPLAGYLWLAYVPLTVGCMATVADGCAVLHQKLLQHACVG